MDEPEMLSRLSEISSRRLAAFVDIFQKKSKSTFDELQAIEDATTPDDLATLSEARRMLDSFAITVLDIWSEVHDGFGTYRCSVCGMTPNQALDANYDCSREC